MTPPDDADDQVLAEGGDDLDEEERAALHASIDESIEDEVAGNTVDLAKIIVELRTGSLGEARIACQTTTSGIGRARLLEDAAPGCAARQLRPLASSRARLDTPGAVLERQRIYAGRCRSSGFPSSTVPQ